MKTRRSKSPLAEAPPAAPASPVNARGEATIVLDGEPFRLRPSFAAIAAIEADTSRTLFDLARSAEMLMLSLSEVGIIVAHCIRAEAKATGDSDHQHVRPERVADLAYAAPGGVLAATRDVIHPLLVGAVTGGYTPQGERKGTTTG